jgi:chaperonin GroES
MKTKVKPLGDRILVKPAEPAEQSSNGIIIPGNAQEKPHEGRVVAVGTGGRDDKGKAVEFTVREGDRVLYSKYGGTEIKVEGDTFLIVREEELLAVVEE